MFTRLALATCLVAVVAFLGMSFYISVPAFDEARGNFAPEIADPLQALTFARAPEGLVLVTAHEGDAVSGINLTDAFGEAETASFLEFVRDLDARDLAGLNQPVESFPLSSLQMPLDYHHPHVAAGTNFKEHADEVYSDDPPFLFPKLAHAGAWNDGVPFTRRLDFEAELCAFPLADVTDAESLPPFGLVLCNDFTDRWTLITQLDLGQPLGLTGFADGKGRAGYLPTGYLVVVPRSPGFYLGVELSLYVNDQLRQRFTMDEVIMPLDNIVTQALETHATRYQQGQGTVPLLPAPMIPKGTLILTGTAAGVLFKPLNVWRQGFYLQPGDVVRTEGTWLGHLENVIVDEAGR